MNLNAIRRSLATVAVDKGYSAFHYVPEDAKAYPVVIIGVPSEIEYGATLGRAMAVFPVTIAVSAASYEDAQKRLDDALSSGTADSLADEYRNAKADTWRSIKILRAGRFRLVKSGGTKALAVDLDVQVIALTRDQEG